MNAPRLRVLSLGAGVQSTTLALMAAHGESGPGARPMHPDWARQIRDACAAAGVAFLFKQHGAWADMVTAWIAADGPVMSRAGIVTD